MWRLAGPTAGRIVGLKEDVLVGAVDGGLVGSDVRDDVSHPLMRNADTATTVPEAKKRNKENNPIFFLLGDDL